jgi:NAD(P)-dependent dehydrogenase (short-subunit alcohol dehydrogenase family)
VAKPLWTAHDIPDQSGRVAIVTGANSGFGFEVTRALARRGANVIMACRDRNKAQMAVARLRSEIRDARLQIEALDVASLASVRSFADRVAQQHPRIDMLINNAGIMATPRQTTEDGFESQLATNHLGHFALTGLLLPCLEASGSARIVPVASIAARQARINLGNLMATRRYNAWLVYNQSKLANLMFGLELHRRLSARGSSIQAITSHPGASLTNLFASPGETLVKQAAQLVRFMFHSAEEGARPLLYAATAAEAVPGGYYGPTAPFETRGPVGLARIPKAARDLKVARALWERSEELTGVRYP